MDQAWLRRAIETKRDGGNVDPAVWRRIIGAYVDGTVDDAPIAALAMACTIRGMADEEILALTDAMVGSGDVLHFPGETIVVDKHSSGGVGDAVSLVVVPLVAACGVPVAKLSGRALGHTGGTLDKLEAIPGVRTDLTPAEFVAQIERIGCAIAAQSERFVPADKRLYALRDRTGSVPSIGLIAASIVSKKLAGGAGAIVFDVKVGGGAFMRTVGEATQLAQTMVRLAGRSGRRATALVSDMDEPLAATIGTGIETLEARDFLRKPQPQSRFGRLTLLIAREMLHVGGIADDEIDTRLERALGQGLAYEQFITMLQAQGADRRSLESLGASRPVQPVRADREAYVTRIDAVSIGETARALVQAHGAFAGIRIVAPVGTPVRSGETVALVYGDAAAVEQVAKAFTYTSEPPVERPLVREIIRDAGVAPVSN